MEVEAKFRVPNREVYRELLRLRQVGNYVVAPLGRVRVDDRYFDTADGRLLAGGYSCRLRTQSGSVIATLKGLGESADAVHRRDEQEIALPELLLDPAAWPESPARALALDLTGGAPLEPLFDLHQSRLKANLMYEARRVAEWSLDEVRAVVGRRPAFYYELEIELGPDGAEADLAAATGALTGQFDLAAEHRSKFTRGLEMLRLRGAAVEGRLSDDEREALENYARGTDSELARRAATVLAWADALPTREIAAATHLSAGRVRYWLRTFRAERMGIFGPHHADDAPPEDGGEAPSTDEPLAILETGPAPAANIKIVVATPEEPQTAERPNKRAAAKDKQRALPGVLDFARERKVDLAAARFTADQAEKLFDGLRKVHGLPKKRAELLRMAALLMRVGADSDPEEPARAGRDLILAQPLADLSTGDRLELACIVGLQREKMKPRKEPALEALEPKQRKETIALAALLQMASAISGDPTGDAAAGIALIDCGREGCEVVLAGPRAEGDAALANGRARHWRDLYKRDLRFTAAKSEPAAAPRTPAPPEPAHPGSDSAKAIPELPPLEAADPMAEAGRKVMFTHFMKMLANEAGARKGEDIEFVHDMRVSTRRLRAAYRIFEPFYEAEAVKAHNKDLRRAGRTLGAVRDLDVLIEKAEDYDASMPPEEGPTVEPLISHWRAQRDVARRDLVAFLDSRAYQRFVGRFREFLLTPGLGAKALPEGSPVAYQVRHVIPRLIMERYEQVRAYEPVIAAAPLTTYHLLRIDCKRLRYALEFFQKLLGPEAPGLIKQVTAMQELLGAMQDAHVAEGMIAAFLEQEAGRKKRRAAHPGVEAYLETQRQIQQDLLALFPAPWAELTGLEFRKSLGSALATP